MRVVLPFLLAVSCSAVTLEKLSLDEMIQKSSLIVRGKITACAGEMRGSVIYTRCSLTVSEQWKGNPAQRTSFVLPGGGVNGLSQTFTGTPQPAPGTEYVFFLWTGRSGTNQIIGLSQGLFSVLPGGANGGVASRPPLAEAMIDSGGQLVQDQGVSMSVAELRRFVRQSASAQNTQ